MIGTLRKLKRFFRSPSGRAVILPLDHGASDGMLHGIGHFPALMAHLNTRNMQGVILNKGFARAHALELSTDIPLILQLSAGTRHGVPSWNKALVCSVPEALRLGADAVAVQLNIGNELEDKMLSDFGMAVEEAHQHGLPVLAVIYAKGERIVQELDPSLITHCIRLGGELGADMVSVPYSGDQASFTRAVASCPVPVLVAGGPSQPDFASFLTMTYEALECGAAGVSVGRNVFQQENPEQALDAILELVHAVPEDDSEDGVEGVSEDGVGGGANEKPNDKSGAGSGAGPETVLETGSAERRAGKPVGHVAANAAVDATMENTRENARENTMDTAANTAGASERSRETTNDAQTAKGKNIKNGTGAKPYATATITPQDVADAESSASETVVDSVPNASPDDEKDRTSGKGSNSDNGQNASREQSDSKSKWGGKR